MHLASEEVHSERVLHNAIGALRKSKIGDGRADHAHILQRVGVRAEQPADLPHACALPRVRRQQRRPAAAKRWLILDAAVPATIRRSKHSSSSNQAFAVCNVLL